MSRRHKLHGKPQVRSVPPSARSAPSRLHLSSLVRSVTLLVAVTAAVAACGSSGSSAPSSSPWPSAMPSVTKPTPPPIPTAAPGTLPGAQAFLDSLGVPAGIVIAPVGGGPLARAGSVTSTVARSAIKVPIALAVLATPGGDAQMSDIQSAITASDNDAGQRLFNSLGPVSQANQLVQAQLAKYGDPNTILPANGWYTEVQWKLTDNARFAAGLACNTGPVTKYMGEVIPDQSFGLGRLKNAKFKGGWGDSSESFGGAAVRQFGFFDAPGGGRLGIAIATFTDGEGDGQLILDKIGKWLTTALLPPGGSCPVHPRPTAPRSPAAPSTSQS